VSLAVLTLLMLMFSELNSFDTPGGATWFPVIPLGPIGFILFFAGVGVGIYRGLLPHDWSKSGNVVVTLAAFVGGFVVGRIIGHSFLGDGRDATQGAMAAFGYGGAVLFAGGAMVASRIHAAKRAAVAAHPLGGSDA